MFETLKRLYLRGDLSNAQLNMAVKKGWITSKQKEQIQSLA